MRQIYDNSYIYAAADGGEIGCYLRVYKAAGGIVAIAGDLRASRRIAQPVATLAEAVWRMHGAPARFTWLQEDAGEDPARPRYRLVEFARRPDGRLYIARRRSISRQAVARLVAQDYAQEWPAAWLSMPTQGMHLECLACGCNLPITAILTNLRYCAACLAAGRTSEPGPVPVPTTPPSAQELFRAREQFRRRAALHEQILGLTPAQRHALFRALAGTRSLWEFQPEELRTLAAKIEQFDSAAEVQEFLEVRYDGERTA